MWKMNVSMYNLICFGVQYVHLLAAYLFAALSQTIGNNCPGIETHLNFQENLIENEL